jgi:cytochrome c-type biogenesis protein
MDEIAEGAGARHGLRAAVFFVLGLSTVFLFLGLAASALGRVLLAHQREMAIVAGAVIALFGLHFLGVLRIPLLYREARFAARSAGGTAFGAYLLGLAFAFGWTPCIGPVLGSILALAAQEGSVERGMLLMAAYAAGLGLPFILTALFLRRAIGVTAGLRRHMGAIERAMGVLLVGVGVMMLTGAFSDFSFWLLETFPALGRVG